MRDNLSTQEVKAGHSQQHSKVKVNLSYVRLYLKIMTMVVVKIDLRQIK